MYIFKTEPWEHQLKALDYLMVRKYGALYTDMGTGKTKVGIDLIVNRGFKFTVIVGTKKACEVWEDEFKIHCCRPNIFVFRLDLYSTPNKVSKLKDIYDRAKNTGDPVVLIVNYDSIWRKPFSDKLIDMPIDCVICDESHRIKSPGSKCSLYLTRIGRRVENRFMFTGTPSTESPIDVYAQYRYLQPDIFGTNFHKFCDRYENVDVQRTLYAGYKVLNYKKPYKNLEELKEKMYSCAFYVESSVELPEVTDITVNFTPSKEIIEVYKELEEEGAFECLDGVIEINNAMVKPLRQQELLSGYIPMEDWGFTTKIHKVVDNSRETCLKEWLEGIKLSEKVVIFVVFREDFEAVKRVCEELKRTYGEISGSADDYPKWKKGKINLLAVQYSSGSESIDLTKARYCVYYSLSRSYSLYLQSRKRVHRPGQKRPVTYCHIVAKIPKLITVDEKIMKAMKKKQDLIDFLISQG